MAKVSLEYEQGQAVDRKSYFRAYKNLPLKEVLQDSLLQGYQDMDKAFLNAYRKTHINGIAKALK